MARFLMAIAFALSAAAAAAAQEGLTPTDVLEGGRFSLTGRLQWARGEAEVGRGSLVDLDAEAEDTRFLYQGAVGLGLGLEIEAAIAYQFAGTVETDGDILGVSFDSREEDSGFGDLTLSPVFRLLEEDDALPQLIVGGIAVLPTGNDKRGEAESTLGALQLSDGEEGGIGGGVWKAGLGAGVSKRAGPAEPYMTAAWLWGGERERNDVDEEPADIWTLALGSELHLSVELTLDFRLVVQILSDAVKESGRVPQGEDGHVQHTWQGQAYVTVAPGVTLVAGLAVTFVEDHEIDKQAGLELEDAVFFAAQAGIHIALGK